MQDRFQWIAFNMTPEKQQESNYQPGIEQTIPENIRVSFLLIPCTFSPGTSGWVYSKSSSHTMQRNDWIGIKLPAGWSVSILICSKNNRSAGHVLCIPTSPADDAGPTIGTTRRNYTAILSRCTLASISASQTSHVNRVTEMPTGKFCCWFNSCSRGRKTMDRPTQWQDGRWSNRALLFIPCTCPVSLYAGYAGLYSLGCSALDATPVGVLWS